MSSIAWTQYSNSETHSFLQIADGAPLHHIYMLLISCLRPAQSHRTPTMATACGGMMHICCTSAVSLLCCHALNVTSKHVLEKRSQRTPPARKTEQRSLMFISGQPMVAGLIGQVIEGKLSQQHCHPNKYQTGLCAPLRCPSPSEAPFRNACSSSLLPQSCRMATCCKPGI